MEAIGRILGYQYEWVEEGHVSEDDGFFPHLQCRRGGNTIDIRQMSTSERWVHYVLWALRQSDARDLVLIDEPESSLATPAHEAFIDEIARVARAAGCQVVVASHSEAMIRRIPSACIRLITRGPDGGRISNVDSTEKVLDALALEPPAVQTVIYVEDDLARRLFEAIIQKYAAHAAGRFDIVDSEGASKAALASRVTQRSRRLTSFAVLDGDERTSDNYADCHFLPGGTPEHELTSALLRNPAAAAASLGVDLEALLIAIDKARFSVHQRVFDVIQRALGWWDYGQLIERCIAIWLEQAEIDAHARALATTLLATSQSHASAAGP